jgi:cellulose synthase/poly-beta-1,6-N-acetylglucosamine synthase-like glycosyltransferase
MAELINAIFWIVIAVYTLCMAIVLWYAVMQFRLTMKANGYSMPEFKEKVVEDWPVVTVQLPVYNERYVVASLIDSVCALDYPASKLEIQILDDSTDDTTEIIRAQSTKWQSKGIDISHIRRTNRNGFKAGALQYGMQRAKGELTAIFDADFRPKGDFLKRVVPYFIDPKVGMVQTRWGHLNSSANLLTRLQALALDAHFSVEQKGRFSSGAFFNFNGTAGVWRIAAIKNAGGWQSDTLTEDLDLSYRAQLLGWHFIYAHDIITPAELPENIEALRTQQFRWTKGAAQCARKHLITLFSNPNIPFLKKLDALAHLGNSSIFLPMSLAVICSMALMVVLHYSPEKQFVLHLAWIFALSLLLLGAVYRSGEQGRKLTFFRYVFDFVLFLSVYMGMSAVITRAVIEAFTGKYSPFVRTPKGSASGNAYVKGIGYGYMLVDAGVALLFVVMLLLSLLWNLPGFAFLFLLLSFGFGIIPVMAIKKSHRADRHHSNL